MVYTSSTNGRVEAASPTHMNTGHANKIYRKMGITTYGVKEVVNRLS